MKLITNSEKETLELGRLIGTKLKSGDVLSLDGDLGAGKTYMTKGIAEGMGIKDYITSPTFTILNIYEGDLTLYHFDVYRIDDPREMEEIGFDEYLYGDGVCVVEWGSIVSELLPEDTIDVHIKKLDDDVREIEILGASFDLKEWKA